MGAMSDATSPRLVGRLQERDVLAGVVGGAADGRPGAMLVHGEAGVGKTRLVREVCEQLRSDGFEILWGTCVHFGSANLPYAPVVSALDRWAGRAGQAVCAEVFAGADELVALLPSMGIRAGDAVPGTVMSWTDTVLLRLARRSPTVLVIDDLQWADAASLDALAYLVTGFESQQLAVVATIRLEERPEGHPLHTWLADVRRLPLVSEVTLERLGAEETQAQITQLLGAPASEELAADVHRRSQGNPYLTELLVKEAPAERQRLPAEPPQALREAVLARWHSLSGPAREVTRLLAVGGRPAGFELLSAVARTALPRVDGLPALLHEAVEGGVLRLGSDRTHWFWHPVLADVLVSSLAPADAAHLHAAYAVELESSAGEGSSAVAADLAVHHEASGHVDDAFRWSLRAAGYAARVLARAEEGAHLARAAALWYDVSPEIRGGEAEHVSLLRRAASAAEAVGDFARAVELLVEALGLVDRATEPLVASELLVAWTRADWGLSPGHRWYRPEMRTAVALTDGWPDSPERAYALARLAQAQSWDDAPDPLDGEGSTGGRLPGLAAAEMALAVARRSGSALALAHALTAHAMVTASDPASQALAELEEAYELARGVDATWMAETAIWQINRLEDEGRLEEAAEVGKRASTEALQAGSTHTGYFLAAQGASFLIDLGRWDEARELLRPALASGGAGVTGAFARCDAALLAVRTGELGEARRHLLRIEEIVRPDFIGVPITDVTVETLLAEGHPRAALDYLEQRWPLHSGGVRSPGLDPLLTWGATAAADLAEQARDRGDVLGLASAVDALDGLVAHRSALPGTPFEGVFQGDRLRQVRALRFAAESARCRADAGQAEAWHRLRERAAAASLRWDEALAAWRCGQALLAEAAPRSAVTEALRASHTIATRLGGRPLVDEVETLARTAHLRLDTVATLPSSPDGFSTEKAPPGLVLLTGREREVVGHILAGRSNAEIARDLYISVKTVSVHVSNILHKTGTGSRVEAAAWAARMARDPDVGTSPEATREAREGR